MDITTEARQRLTEIMESRRLDLGLTWREVGLRAGVSVEAIRLLRAGPGGIRPLTMRDLDRAFGWMPGSVQKILDGGDPEPILTPGEESALETWGKNIREGRARMRETERGANGTTA